ncbi:MAG: glycosyltransferase family 4 protein [Paludibacter sp.]|nr:glycosyltransferase family 4 protein [Paludibacter sp.]
MKNSTKIIYIKPYNSSFIRGDQEIFEREYKVIPFLLNQNRSKIIFGIKLIQLFFYLFFTVFRRNVIFISWFADYHSAIMVLVARLIGKKSVIFIGGQEAVSYPELKKGVYRKKIRGYCVKFALRNTDLIIANHKSLIYHENSYYNQENPHIDGIKHYVKGLNTRTEIIYNGIDSNRIIRDSSINKQNNLILTVGTMNQLGDFYNKGFDLFIETASRCKDLEFVLIGLKPDYSNWVEENYKVSEIKNLQIIPSFCPQDILNEKYNKAKVFVQASITEGMPNTLSEAMLLECIPVGSNINGIPDAIGDTGVIVKHRRVEELENGILEALKMNTGKAACSRVKEMFTFALREEKIINCIQELIEK